MNVERYLELCEKLTYAYVEDLMGGSELISSDFMSSDRLSDGDLVLPLKVKGVFLTEGRPYRKYYSSEELMKASTDTKNQEFKIVMDHRDDDTEAIVGKVDRIKFDRFVETKDGDTKPGLRWWGHINDETVARNISDGLIKQVSVNIMSTPDYSDEHGLVGTELEFVELSLVRKGKEPNNCLKIDR